MDISIWDDEFKSTSKSFKQVEEEFRKNDESFMSTLARKKRVIERSLAAIETIHIKYRRLNQTKDGLTKRLSAIVFWIYEMSALARELIYGYDLYLKQFMWIKLFKIRFLGDEDGSHSYVLKDGQLESIAERFESQKTIETLLHRQHYQLRQEEQELRKSYDLLQAEEANVEASHSLQNPWGRGAYNSQRHPILGEMQRLLFGIGFSVESELSEATQLKILSSNFYRKTQNLMDECRSLMEQNDRTKTPYFDRQKIDHVKKSLKQIKNLEHEVDLLAHRVLPNLRARPPILLKKKTIQVKTMPMNGSQL